MAGKAEVQGVAVPLLGEIAHLAGESLLDLADPRLQPPRGLLLAEPVRHREP